MTQEIRQPVSSRDSLQRPQARKIHGNTPARDAFAARVTSCNPSHHCKFERQTHIPGCVTTETSHPYAGT
jgi:hypothetical protein